MEDAGRGAHDRAVFVLGPGRRGDDLYLTGPFVDESQLFLDWSRCVPVGSMVKAEGRSDQRCGAALTLSHLRALKTLPS